jgi:hypothetical protein
MPEIITGQDAAASFEAAGGAEEAARVDAARAELVDEATGAPGEEGGSSLILGKYQSTEDLANAYLSLQREYTRLKSGQAPVSEAAESMPERPGTAEAPEKGEAPPSADPAVVAQIQESIFQQVGGEAEYQRLATWAANNIPTERLNSYNQALSSGDQAAILNSLKGLQYDFMMKNGYEPRLTGGRAPSNEIRGYESEAQVVAAMKDPRYSGDNPDPAYIKEVERRIAVSNVFQTR